MALPFLYSFVQFDSSYTSVFLLVSLLIPQMISGNIIEPKIMGKRLNLSSSVIILSLLFWSSLWGIIGAFLSVPIMAVIIFQRWKNRNKKIIPKVINFFVKI